MATREWYGDIDVNSNIVKGMKASTAAGEAVRYEQGGNAVQKVGDGRQGARVAWLYVEKGAAADPELAGSYTVQGTDGTVFQTSSPGWTVDSVDIASGRVFFTHADLTAGTTACAHNLKSAGLGPLRTGATGVTAVDMITAPVNQTVGVQFRDEAGAIVALGSMSTADAFEFSLIVFMEV